MGALPRREIDAPLRIGCHQQLLGGQDDGRDGRLVACTNIVKHHRVGWQGSLQARVPVVSVCVGWDMSFTLCMVITPFELPTPMTLLSSYKACTTATTVRVSLGTGNAQGKRRGVCARTGKPASAVRPWPRSTTSRSPTRERMSVTVNWVPISARANDSFCIDYMSTRAECNSERVRRGTEVTVSWRDSAGVRS